MIYKKLRDFKKLGITVEKDGRNSFFKKDGKDSEYTTLNEVLEKVEAPLLELGVLIVQEPTADGLRTRLIDIDDGDEVSGLMPWVGADNAQKLLACTTYYRRGSLVSMLGLQASDDDGNTASAAKAPQRAVASATPAPKGPVDSNDQPFETVIDFNL